MRSGRRRSSSSKWVVLALLGMLVGGGWLVSRAMLGRSAPLLSPALQAPTPASGTIVNVAIAQGETTADIARDLQEKGLVPSEAVFLGVLKLRGTGSSFQPGVHEVTAGWSIEQIIAALEQPVAPKDIRITLPEGLRMEEQADLAARAGIGVSQDFVQLATQPDPSWDYDFLADRPKGASLQGYLFPDTYLVPGRSPNPRDLIKRMLDAFDKRVDTGLRQKVAANKHTLYDTLIIASIVEREAKVPAERPLIAGVYWNRLNTNQGLFADPTVQYALGKPGSWWPRLSADDLKVNSPYNTYTHPGLPPGPIANPGLASIQAAANPQGDFLYFVAKNDGSGEHAFARTLAEHNANRAKYGS